MRWPRRVWRVIVVLTQWGRYLLVSGSPRLVMGDLRLWFRTTILGDELFELDLPWLCFPAVRFLDTWIEPGMNVFEWGSGASTIFFARRGCRVTSVEHDPTWVAELSGRMAAHPHLEVLAVAEAGGEYPAAIDRCRPGTVDLVLVDGARRCECLLAALSRVKPGGLLILDDSEREMYRSCLSAVPEQEWETRHFHGPKPSSVWPAFTRTTCLTRRILPETRPSQGRR